MTVEEIAVEVYWRPGCGACGALRVVLAEAGVPAEWRNICEDPAGSAFVRSVAGGNETVPTLVIDGRAHVAPSPRRAVEEIARVAPHLVQDSRRWPPLRLVQWVTIITLLVASEFVAASGHVGWSYGVDAVAVLAYLALRRLRASANARGREGNVAQVIAVSARADGTKRRNAAATPAGPRATARLSQSAGSATTTGSRITPGGFPSLWPHLLAARNVPLISSLSVEGPAGYPPLGLAPGGAHASCWSSADRSVATARSRGVFRPRR